MRIITSSAFAAILVLVFSACSSSYTPSRLSHTYTTSTQDYHIHTAIRMKGGSDWAGATQKTVEDTLTLTASWLEAYVNGELAARYNMVSGQEVEMKLPPGKHIVEIVMVNRGLLTLGTKHQRSFAVYEVELDPGDIGYFEFQAINASGQGAALAVPEIYGMDYRVLEAAIPH